jgi:outer membrane protein TolC
MVRMVGRPTVWAVSVGATLLLIGACGCTTVPIRGPAVSHFAEMARPKASRTLHSKSVRGDAAIPPDCPVESISAAVKPRESDPADGKTEVTLVEATEWKPANRPPAEPEIVLADAEAEFDTPPAVPPAPETNASQPPAPYTFSLSNVLYLADAQNPNVAVARERINEAYARVDRAEALWLPSIRAGLNYNHHEGSIQDVRGDVFNTNRSSFYGGLGANAVGAGSPAVPGLVAQFHLSDAIFQPKITTHQAASRQFGATAARNDVLRDAAVAYLELVRSEHAQAIAQEALDNTHHLADLTRQFAEAGQGLQSDHQRMEAESAVRQDRLISSQEAVAVASARLAQVLHADPSARIASGEPMVVPLDILEHGSSAASFVATGLSRRPELAEQKHLVCEAVERLRREQYAPLVPSVLLGFSYGGLGGGLGSSIIHTDDRWDADAVAFWEIRNLGVGERSARGEAASVMRQAQMRELAVLDRVAREVVEAHAQVTERERRIDVAKQGIVAAEKSYALNLQRIENAQGLPIEALQSIQALATARSAYLNAVVDYNVAQFELCRAIGWFE